MKYRRFGKTEFQMPVISCGGMRYQQSWKTDDPVGEESQRNLEACILHAFELGVNHIETARGYGTSEYQLSKVIPKLPREKLLLQTKVGPMPDVKKFEATFEKSIGLLGVDYLDIFSFHGINDEETLADALKCLELAQRWKREGRIRDIGFSTHGPCPIIVKAIRTGHFDHVNLHWYYIFQENWPAIEEATRRDMGVFIISPNDKGGLLYKPSEKLVELCAPLHPMVFNGLFCLSHPEVHTLSCGASRPTDFDVHMETVKLLDRAGEILPAIHRRLQDEVSKKLGDQWAATWDAGLPDWDETPGEINMRWILRLRNLAVAYDMLEYGKMRYNMLGNGGHWFPGQKADKLDDVDLKPVLAHSPHAAAIPAALADAHRILSGEKQKRLQEA
jgi:hypothetical protein